MQCHWVPRYVGSVDGGGRERPQCTVRFAATRATIQRAWRAAVASYRIVLEDPLRARDRAVERFVFHPS